MSLHHQITVLPVTESAGQGWGAEVLHRLVNPSDPGVPAEQRTSLADYFADCTMQEVTLSGRVAPETVLSADDPDWVAVRTGTKLGVNDRLALTLLVEKCRVNGASFAPGDILLVVGSLPSDREFATQIVLRDQTYSVTYVSTQSTHQVIAHELGHTLGFAHPYGLVHDVFGRATTEYGSPYCVMGPASRHHEVSTSLTPWPLFPDPASVRLFHRAGPRLSLAELVAWGYRRGMLPPFWLGDRASQETLPDEGWAEFSVTDQDGPADVPRVVVGVTSTGQVLTFEVRRPLGRPVDWDAALDLRRATDLWRGGRLVWGRRGPADESDLHDSPGVVVHRIASVLDPDAETADFQTGNAWLPHRAVYVGTIPLPLSGDTDLRWLDAREWRIRAVAADRGTVRLQVGTAPHPAEKGARLVSLRSHTTETGRSISGPFEVTGVGEDCHAGQYYAFQVTHEHQVLLQAHSHGFDDPEICWVVEGHEFGWGGIGSTRRSTVTLTLPVQVPTGYQVSQVQQHSVTVEVHTGWDQARVWVRSAPGRAQVQVACLVRGRGHTVTGATAQLAVEVVGTELEFPASLSDDVRACTGKFFDAITDLHQRFPDLVTGAVLTGNGIKVPPRDWLLSQWQEMLGSLADQPEITELDRERLGSLGVRRPW